MQLPAHLWTHIFSNYQDGLTQRDLSKVRIALRKKARRFKTSPERLWTHHRTMLDSLRRKFDENCEYGGTTRFTVLEIDAFVSCVHHLRDHGFRVVQGSLTHEIKCRCFQQLKVFRNLTRELRSPKLDLFRDEMRRLSATDSPESSDTY